MIGQDFAREVDRWFGAEGARARPYGSLAGCVSVLRDVSMTAERTERVACLLSDVVLASALNWQTAMLVTAHRLNKTLFPELAVQVSILASVEYTIRMVRGLARCFAAHRSIMLKRRAKGPEAGVDLPFAQATVAPASMPSPMIRSITAHDIDRTAQRFCDRLVELGVARELTGRPNFSLYGIAL